MMDSADTVLRSATIKMRVCTTCPLFSLVGHHVPSPRFNFLYQHAEKSPLTSSFLLFSISLSSLLPCISWQVLICGFQNVCCTATGMIMMLVDPLLSLS